MQHHAKLRSLHHCQATDKPSHDLFYTLDICETLYVFINVVCCRALNRWITWISCEVDQREEGLVDTWIDGWVWKWMKEKPETTVGPGWASDLHRTRPRPVTSTREGLSKRPLGSRLRQPPLLDQAQGSNLSKSSPEIGIPAIADPSQQPSQD